MGLGSGEGGGGWWVHYCCNNGVPPTPTPSHPPLPVYSPEASEVRFSLCLSVSVCLSVSSVLNLE